MAAIEMEDLPVEQREPKRHLGYATKMFPLNALVTIIGRKGIYRVVSEPYIPAGYSYPHFDVESLGRKFRASVFTASRICLSSI